MWSVTAFGNPYVMYGLLMLVGSTITYFFPFVKNTRGYIIVYLKSV